MNELRKLFYLLLIIPIMFVNTGCSDDDDGGTEPETINETEVLVKYLEANGDPVNTFGQYIKTIDVKSNLDLQSDQYIIDIRSAEDFANGHIEGAHQVNASDVLSYYETNNLSSKERVTLVCYSGQTAGWVASLMHMVGHINVKTMSFGMSSWNPTTAAMSWAKEGKISNAKAGLMVTEATAKAAAGDLPTFQSTGETEGANILRARVEAVFAEGFSPAAAMSNGSLFDTPENYYIVNYWSLEHYNQMHIPGAIQYTPQVDLNLATSLKTLPKDKTIAVYCYTGQTSAHIAAYLRVLGYDAKSVLYGVNQMAHDTMPGTAFDETQHVYNHPLVQ